MNRVEGRAYSRVGLLGNPSDQYGGKVIAFSLRDFSARVVLEPSSRFEIVRGSEDSLDFPDFHKMVESLRQRGCYDGVRLIRAALLRFDKLWRGHRPGPGDPRLRFRISYHTDIPRQAGLSGSSAIVIAAFRALMRWFEVTASPFELAEAALAAEVEDLGIQAGPMDRVVQAYEGAYLMDFSEPRTPDSYQPLDPALFPPLFVAYDPKPGKDSGTVHSDVYRRWKLGDPEVRRAIGVFSGLVDRGVGCLAQGDRAGFRDAMNRNFDQRASLWDLSERDLEMVRIGRRRGCGVKLCGSGGAVVGAMKAADEFSSVQPDYEAAGYRVLLVGAGLGDTRPRGRQ